MKLRYLIYLCMLCCTAGTYAQSRLQPEQLRALNPADPAEQIIQQESDRLDSLVTRTKIWISDNVANQFDPVFGVVINKAYVLRKAQEMHIKDMASLFRMIIAHEKMHALQYQRLQATGRTFASLTSEEQQLLECQADMCAGYLFLFPHIKQYSEVLARALVSQYHQNAVNPQHPVMNYNDGITDNDSAMIMNTVAQGRDGINLFFSLGENEGVLNVHPSPTQRKEAFQMGVSAFLFTSYTLPLPPAFQSSLQPDEWQYLNMNFNMTKFMLGILPLDYSQNGGFFESWSYRMAFKFIHVLNNASRNVLFHVTRNQWNTSAEDPSLYFGMEVTNNNPDSVLIDMSVLIKLVSRKHPDDPLRSNLISNWYKIVTLGPGQTVQVNDTAYWMRATDTTMPSVFYPGQEGSMYVVQPLRPKNPELYMKKPLPLPAAPASLELGTGTASGTPANTLRVFPSVYRRLQTSPLADFQHGAGLKWMDDTYTGFTFYDGGTRFELRVSDGQELPPSLTTVLADVATVEEAKDLVTNGSTQLLSLMSGLALRDTPQDIKYPYAIVDKAGKRAFRLYTVPSYFGYQVMASVYR